MQGAHQHTEIPAWLANGDVSSADSILPSLLIEVPLGMDRESQVVAPADRADIILLLRHVRMIQTALA